MCHRNVNKLADVECTVQGTYFLCDGSTTDVSVLKVRAKRLHSSNATSTESKRFINSMQEALQGRFGSEQFVALGGVYTVDNADWDHRLIPNEWENMKGKPGSFCEVKTTETMITTFSSSTELQSKQLELPIKSSQSIHSLSHHSSSVNVSRISAPKNVEYLGYFCPATTLYRIDE